MLKTVKNDYFIVVLFFVLVLINQLCFIFKNDFENLNIIVFNKVTYLYLISFSSLFFFLRIKPKLLFYILLVFYSDFFIEIKYIIQPYTFPIISGLLYKQILTISCLLGVSVVAFFLIQRYFKYAITVFCIKYLVSIVFVTYSKNVKYYPTTSNVNYTVEKNCYILLFDEYPSQFVINNYLSHKEIFLDSLVKRERFINITDVRSNYLNTEMSIPSILYSKTSNTFRVRDALNSLQENIFTKRNKFVAYSLFDKVHSNDAINNSNFIHSINSLVTRYFFPLLFRLVDGQGHGVFYNVEEYHNNALKLLETVTKYKGKKKQVVFVHFFSPHDQLFTKQKNMLERIDEANQYMSKSLMHINRNDPGAAVIIISDHGFRGDEVPKYYKYNGLLLYRNVTLNTKAIKKYGLVCLFK